MNELHFLNRRWNIIISLVQGIPTFAFALFAIFTGLSSTLSGMIAISVAGSLFCLLLEYHSSARFLAEWRRTGGNNKNKKKPRPGNFSMVLLVTHNLLFWFFLIPLFTSVSYHTGFISFTIILFLRFMGAIYINMKNFNAEQYYRYPFRIP